jgi:hypothetical protein
MATPYSSTGTLLQMDDGGGITFTTIAQVMDIDGPTISVDTEETTNQSSPGGYEEVIPTIKRSGEVTFDVLFDPSDATHDATTGMIFVLNGRLKRSFREVFPTTPSKRWNFTGYITNIGTAAPVAGLLRAPITIKVTGQPTLS